MADMGTVFQCDTLSIGFDGTTGAITTLNDGSTADARSSSRTEPSSASMPQPAPADPIVCARRKCRVPHRCWRLRTPSITTARRGFRRGWIRHRRRIALRDWLQRSRERVSIRR